MNAVSNSSILIALSRIGRLEILSRRFQDGIVVPQAVWREVVVDGANRAGVNAVAQAGWIAVHNVQSRIPVNTLVASMDLGEAEAIALALELNPSNILLDETAARVAARRMGLSVLGTVGLLIWAKRALLISSLRADLDRLVNEGQFRLSQDVRTGALAAVGEL